jgi:hypothetical protein
LQNTFKNSDFGRVQIYSSWVAVVPGILALSPWHSGASTLIGSVLKLFRLTQEKKGWFAMSSFTVRPGRPISPLNTKREKKHCRTRPKLSFRCLIRTFILFNVALWAHGGAIWTSCYRIREGN